MSPGLEPSPCGQILQNKDNGRSKEKLSHAQIKDIETTYFFILEVKETSQTTREQKFPQGSKKGGAPDHNMFC